MHNFENLSATDFEWLCLDIVNAETNLRFSAFGSGPDGGIDGWYSEGENTSVLQCKHYFRSSFSDLKNAAKKELANIKRLKPNKYIFFTSQSLTPKNMKELSLIFALVLEQGIEIWGRDDIEAALRRHPNILKAHFKLWISSTAVLEKIFHSNAEAFTSATEEEILDDVKVYVRNDSFDEAIKKLEEEKVLIVSGIPGVGKTTLAKMVLYNYLSEGWALCVIKSLDQDLLKLEGNERTIFFFDDFLGQIELARDSLVKHDSELSLFVRRVKRSKKSRFILTTRSHIFEEAKWLSDQIDDQDFHLARYLLDVELYTRKIKAYIFFNHLSLSKLSMAHYEAFLEGGWLSAIVDHKNYSPRIIAKESRDCPKDVKASEYPKHIYAALENPKRIWEKSYNSLGMKSQNLLITLFFSDQYGVSISELKESYGDLNRLVCSVYTQPNKPSDFNEALLSLETGFIKNHDKFISFVNPSVRDFLKGALRDVNQLHLLPEVAKKANWAINLWNHGRGILDSEGLDTKAYAVKFLRFASIIDNPKVKSRSQGFFFRVLGIYDLQPSFGKIVSTLFEWWEHSGEPEFLLKALSILKKTPEDLGWPDIREFLELYSWVEEMLFDVCLIKPDFLSSIEKLILSTLRSRLNPEELASAIDDLNNYLDDRIPLEIADEVNSQVAHHFESVETTISNLNMEYDLRNEIGSLQLLSQSSGYDCSDAVRLIEDCINDLDEDCLDDDIKVEVKPRKADDDDNFNNDELYCLFSKLIND